MENYYSDVKVKANNEPMAQPEHLSIAVEFANNMYERFQPMEQNELLNTIKMVIKERRENELCRVEKQFSYLKESMEFFK